MMEATYYITKNNNINVRILSLVLIMPFIFKL